MYRIKTFLQNNVVVLTVIPGLIGVHWGWQKIQENEIFVKEHERRTEFPLVTGYKLVKGKIFGPDNKNIEDNDTAKKG